MPFLVSHISCDGNMIFFFFFPIGRVEVRRKSYSVALIKLAEIPLPPPAGITGVIKGTLLFSLVPNTQLDVPF